MNFKEWSKKYYPNEVKETLEKMSHAWARSHAEMVSSKINKDFKQPHDKEVATDACCHEWEYFSPAFNNPYKKCTKCDKCQ